MNIVGLIPARKNSRRLKDKNWREVGGLPLWLHALNHARDSGVCDVIAISTDDERIVNAPHDAVRIPQPQFEQSYNVMLEVVCHANLFLWEHKYKPDAFVILQPTSPLRTAQDVLQAVTYLRSDSVDAVVSVTEGADDIAFIVRHANRLEKLPQIVVPNGAVYAIKAEVLRSGGSWYGPHTYAYFMPKERSIDIDNEVDLEMAQAAWQRLHG